MMNGYSMVTDRSLLPQSRGVFDAGTHASMFAASGGFASDAKYYASETNTVSIEDEQDNKGNDSFFCDLPELGGFDDFETNMRNSNTTFEIENNYFDDTLWSSICSPVALLVPSNSCFGSTDISSVQNQSATATLTESSVSVPYQINTTHSTNVQKQSRTDGRNHTPSNNEPHISSSSEEFDKFSRLIDAELFGPFDDNVTSAKKTGGCEGLEATVCSANRGTQVPTASSTMLPDQSVVVTSSACCSGPDLAAAPRIRCSSKRKLNDALHGTPDMLLEGMAENPLEMYFPPLPTTSEQPEEALARGTSKQPYRFHQEFAGSTSSAPSCAGMQFRSEGMSSAELHKQPRSTLILDAVPVKDLGFHKLQNGMNQMDVATKGRIRDALYRLANSVEQRHYIASTSGLAVGSSRSNRFRSGRWTEGTQANPMDQSVAQLLLQKPPHRNTVSPSRA